MYRVIPVTWEILLLLIQENPFERIVSVGWPQLLSSHLLLNTLHQAPAPPCQKECCSQNHRDGTSLSPMINSQDSPNLDTVGHSLLLRQVPPSASSPPPSPCFLHTPQPPLLCPLLSVPHLPGPRRLSCPGAQPWASSLLYLHHSLGELMQSTGWRLPDVCPSPDPPPNSSLIHMTIWGPFSQEEETNTEDRLWRSNTQIIGVPEEEMQRKRTKKKV